MKRIAKIAQLPVANFLGIMMGMAGLQIAAYQGECWHGKQLTELS